jgi:hypothetical protein
MRLIQLEQEKGQIVAGVVDDDGDRVRVLDGVADMRELALRAIAAQVTLEPPREPIGSRTRR